MSESKTESLAQYVVRNLVEYREAALASDPDYFSDALNLRLLIEYQQQLVQAYELKQAMESFQLLTKMGAVH